MDIPILLFLGCIVVAMVTLLLLRNARAADVQPVPANGSSAWVTVLSTPALLVPAALAAVVATLTPTSPHGSIVPDAWRPDSVWLSSMGVLAVMAMLVAGFIGLLKPLRAGSKPDGAHFWAGIKDHTVTIFLGKVLVLFFVDLIGRNLLATGTAQTTFSTIFLVAPSLVLAPLVGTTALHPRRPLRAFKAAFERVAWDLAGTSRLLCGQILLSVLIWIAFSGQARDGFHSLHVLATEASALSFNCFLTVPSTPFGGLMSGTNILFTACLMITSTVFMLLYHRRVMNVPERPEGGRPPRG